MEQWQAVEERAALMELVLTSGRPLKPVHIRGLAMMANEMVNDALAGQRQAEEDAAPSEPPTMVRRLATYLATRIREFASPSVK